MKKISFEILILILLCTLLATSSFAFEQGDLPAEVAVIKVGYIEGSEHIVSTNDAVNSGVGYDYFTEIEEYTNYEFQHVSVTPKTGFEMLQRGEIDLIGPLSASDTFTNNYIKTQNPVSGAEIVITAPRNSGIAFNDFEKIEQSVIGIEDYGYYNAYESLLNEYSLQNGLNLSMVESENRNVMAWDINAGNYDLHLVEYKRTNNTLEIVASLGYEPLYYFALPSNDALIEEIDSAMNEILNEDYAFGEKLSIKYSDNSNLAKTAYTIEETEFLQAHGLVNVFYNKDNAPFQWQDENGVAQGVSIEIMDLIAQDLGIEVNYINEDNEGEGTYKGADLSLSILYANDFDNEYYKTNPYAYLPLSLIGEPQTESSDHLYVGSLHYNDLDFSTTLQTTGSYIIAYYNTVEEMANALRTEKVDFVVSPNATNEYIMSLEGDKNFFATQLDYELPMQIYVPEDANKEFVDVLNNAILRLDATEIDGIIAQSRLHYIPKTTISDVVSDNLLYIIFACSLIVFAFFLVVYLSNKRRQKDLIYNLNHDALTGVLSKYGFFERANKLLENAKSGEFTLYFLDIDNFKIVNESFGYSKGSSVIKHLADSITQSLDSRALVAREANDKFIFITPTINENLALEESSKQDLLFRLALRQILVDDYTIHVSIGKYIIDAPKRDLDYMLDCANYARILAKKGFGNKIVEFTSAMQQKRKLQNEIVAGMESALFNDEFEVYYQPKVDLNTKKIVGAEALVRWIRDGVPIFYPDQFIPIFESNMFILRLDYFVTQRVCWFIKENYALLSNYKISINLSGITLMHENLIENLLATTSKSSIEPSDLEFEITESAFVENFDFVVDAITNLQEHGFAISMDDFGSGLSSYNRFKDIPLDILKLDKGFCSFEKSDEKGSVIIESIIRLAKQLNLKVVAEGVETKEQAMLLKDIGCDIAQGYLYAKPMKASEFLQLLRSDYSTNWSESN